MNDESLTRFGWLSILTAVISISLKAFAYFLTGSVGLLSDALESVVNLVAAIMALSMLTLAEKPPDKDHAYGHSKAEYFSSVTEGILIFVAAISIGFTAIDRILHPRIIEQVLIGLTISAIASVINFTVAVILLKTGKKYRSITLEADGHHLMTDVWTSAGVIIGVALVAFTNVQILDPIIAILVAVNIVYTGIKIIKESTLGLMDTSLLSKDLKIIESVLKNYCKKGISYHGLRTRQSANRRFMSVHILVPGNWSVQKGHDLLDEIETKICNAIPKITVITHLEPIEDPKSLTDISIDRS
ncbi:transporter [Candidatus Gottesmanbacteria bacterium RIFCSPHIGHO2_02_FULL_39_14]|uniref:Transporter n=1 Tax=Candidatus Gottesmanbacteria bacterium RIFCSPHIGHO2_02_FULL_39_14 TaxID=1798383 RepID=A0A1F5ZYT5_9BACT|nr:MAG: transporter [Candidatus Gottesmanbacteria bacterium RIFCSPHIGHO2_02_FULL_39_14]